MSIICHFRVITGRDERVGVLLFQAEDGIRDLVRSRGLGDVYKRQVETQHNEGHQNQDHPGAVLKLGQRKDQHDDGCTAVSYTHLTLPTSDLV